MKCAVLLIVACCMLAVVTCAVTNHEKTTEDVNTDDNDTQEVFIQSYQNNFDGPLKVTCSSGRSAINRIKSVHSNSHEDRRWRFICSKVIKPAHCFKCKKSGFVNDYRQPIMFNCPANQVLTGVESYHNNGKEDRIWKFTCCESFDHVTMNCELSGFINELDKRMDYTAQNGKVIVGLHSYYSSGTRDRQWKAMICDYKTRKSC